MQTIYDTATHRYPATGAGRGLTAWLRLGAMLLILAGLVFIAGPLGLRLPGYRQMARFIASRDLKATAIYYTDLEEFAGAESAIRDSLRFAPGTTARQVPARPGRPR